MNFQEEIESIDENIGPNSTYIKYIKQNLLKAKKFIKKAKKNNPNLNYKDFHVFFENTISEIILTYSNPSKSDFNLLNTLENMTQNPDIILETLEKMDRITLFNSEIATQYDYNEKNNVEKVLKSIFSGNFSIFNTDIKVKIIKMDLDDNSKNLLIESISENVVSLKKYVKETVIKKGLQNRIQAISKFLDTYGFLELYNRQNSKNLALNNLDFLIFKYDEPKSKHSTVKDLTKIEFLEKLPLTQLMAINSFISNRFEKEYKNLENSFYILDKTSNLEPLMQNDEYEFSINADTLKNLINQITYIETYILQKNKNSFFNSIVTNGTRVNSNFTKEIDSSIFTDFIIDKADEYSSYYQQLIPDEKHDLSADTLTLSSKFLNMRNFYLFKDFSLIPLINHLVMHPEINWGYTLDYDEDGKNSIENNSNQIGIKIDIEDLNYPLSLHANKRDIIKIFNAKRGKPIIPIYEGNNDTVIEDETLYPQILMPLEKHQKKNIKKLLSTIKPSDPRYNFIAHMNWICDRSNIPESIRKLGISQNLHRTINLNTGEISFSPRFPKKTTKEHELHH